MSLSTCDGVASDGMINHFPQAIRVVGELEMCIRINFAAELDPDSKNREARQSRSLAI